MAKTIAQKSVELAEANAELTSQVAALEAVKGDLSAKLEAATAQVADLTAKLSESAAAVEAAKAQTAEAAGNLAAITDERDALSAKVKELSATLALHPEVKQPNGQSPVQDSPSGDVNEPQTWDQAMKACGGDYVAARRKYGKVFEAFLNNAKSKK